MKTITKGLEIIDQFLASWKVEVFNYYVNLRKEMKDRKNQTYEITNENLTKIRKFYWDAERKYNDDQIERIMDELENKDAQELSSLKNDIARGFYYEWFYSRNKSDMTLLEKVRNDDEMLNKILDKDVEMKKKAFIKKIETKAGNIVDASLSIGDDGNINGLITGDKAKVKIETVLAGGHNIQCLHYRVLVKVLKG